MRQFAPLGVPQLEIFTRNILSPRNFCKCFGASCSFETLQTCGKFLNFISSRRGCWYKFCCQATSAFNKFTGIMSYGRNLVFTLLRPLGSGILDWESYFRETVLLKVCLSPLDLCIFGSSLGWSANRVVKKCAVPACCTFSSPWNIVKVPGYPRDKEDGRILRWQRFSVAKVKLFELFQKNTLKLFKTLSNLSNLSTPFEKSQIFCVHDTLHALHTLHVVLHTQYGKYFDVHMWKKGSTLRELCDCQGFDSKGDGKGEKGDKPKP